MKNPSNMRVIMSMMEWREAKACTPHEEDKEIETDMTSTRRQMRHRARCIKEVREANS